MPKCNRCMVRISEKESRLQSGKCGKCYMDERIEWYRNYERMTVESPANNPLARKYRRDKRRGWYD